MTPAELAALHDARTLAEALDLRRAEDRRAADAALAERRRQALVAAGITDAVQLPRGDTAGRRHGLPVVAQWLPNGDIPSIRIAWRANEVGPGPALECLPARCRKWRTVEEQMGLDPWAECTEWALVRGE